MEFFWYLIGAILVLLETVVVGVGFLFIGLAAISVGLMITVDYLAVNDYMVQLGWFFGFTALWAALLWKPLKMIMNRGKASEYRNIVGQTAIVYKSQLVKGREGKVRWSGTNMNARIEDGVDVETIAEGQEVEIVRAEGVVLFVKPKQ